MVKVEELINQHSNLFTESDRQVAKIILTQKQEISQMTTEQAAKRCLTSRATLLRFCRKIGLHSFSDLKILLSEKQEKREKIQTEVMKELYHGMIEELAKTNYEHICKKIKKAPVIYIYGTGNEQKTLADELKRIFLSVGKCVITLFDYGEIAFLKEEFTKDDLFVVISLSGEGAEGIRILEMVTKTKVQTVSITRLANNKMAAYCDENLYVMTKQLEASNHMSYELVAGFYVLLDVLFLKYLQICEEES